MDNRFDHFIEGLQRQIFEDTRIVYGEVGFQLWRERTCTSAIQNADGHGRQTAASGGMMEFFLKFENKRVRSASFLNDGCASATTCGLIAAELALNKTPAELAEVTAKKILKRLSGLSEEDRHAASLAARTLQAASNDYLQKLERLGTEKSAR